MAEIFNLMVSSKVVQFTDDFLYPLFDLLGLENLYPFPPGRLWKRGLSGPSA